MSTPFLSEIKIMAFTFPPKGWALCNGQLLPINQNQALFSLLGTTYGGNGQTNFALPDLRGRTPIHRGGNHTLGERAGSESVTLTVQTIPTHVHTMSAESANADTTAPGGNVLAASNNLYAAPDSLTALSPAAVTNIGGSQPHTNMQPYGVVSFCIALQGIFPSQS